MDMTIRPMTPEERKYTYDQSNQLNIQTQCVGHLRADLGKDGKEFFSGWTDHVWTLNTKEFKDGFDAVINALRFDEKYGGILKDRRSLAAYCHDRPEASFEDGGNNYGFRVDAGEYAYMCRINPEPGQYNLYCYCYVSKWLDRHIHEAQRGIRFITSRYKDLFRIPDGDSVRIQFSDGTAHDRACRYIDDTHVEVGRNFYHICEFAEKMEAAHNTVISLRSSLPEQCYVYLPTTQEIGIVKKGEKGYYRSELSPVYGEDRQSFVDEMNRSGGVTKAQAAAMSTGSMFGWAAPAADPASYDEQGKLMKPRHADRGDAR